MMIFVFIGMGVVLFTIGASFVLKAYLNTPNENTIVPKAEFDKVKLALTQSQESETKFKEQIEQLNIKLETVKQNLAASKEKEDSALKNLQEWQTKTISSEETYKKTIHQFETELILIREKAETQAKGALEMVTSLRTENESLQNSLHQKIQELNTALQTKEEARAYELTKKEAQDQYDEEKQEALNRIAALENEKAALLAGQMDLERDLEKVKALSAGLSKKEAMIQYELTKARAQAMGLEKIAEDFKMEIERQSKEINDLKAGAIGKI